MPCLLMLLLCAFQDDGVGVVQKLIAAFNAHDAEALAALVAEDVVWYGYGKEGFAVEARGREALRQGMADYFKALPTVSSVMERHLVSGSYVSFRERVTWENASGTQSQFALAVYQVVQGRVVRAWYFPAEKDTEPRVE